MAGAKVAKAGAKAVMEVEAIVMTEVRAAEVKR